MAVARGDRSGTVAEALASLRKLVDAVDRGEVEATAGERAAMETVITTLVAVTALQ